MLDDVRRLYNNIYLYLHTYIHTYIHTYNICILAICERDCARMSLCVCVFIFFGLYFDGNINRNYEYICIFM